MQLASIDPGFWTLQSIFLAALFACTVYRAVKECFPRRAKAGPIAMSPNLANEADVPDEAPIKHRSYFRDDRAAELPGALEQVQRDQAAVARVASASAALINRLYHVAGRGLRRSRIQAARLISTVEARMRPDQPST